MPDVSLRAHFNGKQIVLDEPFDLPKDSTLLVTVLPSNGLADDADWQNISAGGLARAFDDNEPDYDDSDLKK